MTESNLFDFIADDEFRSILERDYSELHICLTNKAIKSVLVLSGSIIEAVLVEYFKNNLPEDTSENKILSMNLYKLIELASEKNLISQRSKNLSTVLKNYRNLIHPGREVRTKETIDVESANVAANIVRMVIKEVRVNYLENHGYRAIDVFNKLETDKLSHSIFERLVAKLNNHEKSKLLNMLSDHDLETDFATNHNIDPLIYINLLKPLVKKETIVSQVEKLHEKVETGESWQVMVLYRLYHYELEMIEKEKRDTIVIYVLTVLMNDMSDKRKVREHFQDKIFSTIGRNVNSEATKVKFGEFIKHLVKNYKKDSNTYFQIYEQLLNSLENERRDKLRVFIKEKIPTYWSEPFLDDFMDGEYLPF